MVMEVVHEDLGEGSMQCTNHPYKNSTPGGICAFCLQEKLGKLVSSSFPVAVFPSSSSSSSSPSFRSDFGGGGGGAAAVATAAGGEVGSCNVRRSRLPFVLTTQRRRKKKDCVSSGDVVNSSSGSIVFKRSKSTETPRRGMMGFMDEDYSPHRRGFWSFLYLSSKHNGNGSKRSGEKSFKDLNFATTPSAGNACGGGVGSSSSSLSSTVGGATRVGATRERKREEFVTVDENGGSPSFDRKVSRSRSVGCGSRSFSGDFFERISTGFGDCTLRRVESQREGKSKVQHSSSGQRNGGECIKERVRCGGIFSGFMITSSSSSSSSSSYWVSSSAEENNNGSNVNGSVNGKAISSMRNLSHGRSKSWGWALASPMRAFGKPSSKRDGAAGSSDKNVTPNLAAIPSLLAVSG